MTRARMGKGTRLFHSNTLLSGGGECYNYNLFQSVSNHCKISCIERRNKLHLRWLYMLFCVRGIGTNGASAWVFKRISILMTSLKGVLSDLKTHNDRVPDCEFFLTIGKWISFFFLSLLRKKSSYTTHTLTSYASKRKIANSSKIYVQIFLWLCQLKLIGYLLCFPWNKESSSCRNL